MTDEERRAYKAGFIDGLDCYAWWKDGACYVGTTGMTLSEAITKVEEQWSYSPHLFPKEE